MCLSTRRSDLPTLPVKWVSARAAFATFGGLSGIFERATVDLQDCYHGSSMGAAG